jgi:integrase
MQNVRRWWEKNRDDLGAPGLVPYELRHSNLTKMARYMNVFDLQRWAGWASIAPAKVYVHADQASMQAAVRRSQVSAGIETGSGAPNLHQAKKQARQRAV